MRGLLGRVVVSVVAVLTLTALIPGCGFSEDGKIYVVMASGDMSQHGLMSDNLEYTTSTLEELGLDSLTDELIGIYDKYDGMAEGVTDSDELLSLFARRQGELAQTIVMGQSVDQMLNLGVPAGIYRKRMSKLDEALFPNKESYLAIITRPR